MKKKDVIELTIQILERLNLYKDEENVDITGDYNTENGRFGIYEC